MKYLRFPSTNFYRNACGLILTLALLCLCNATARAQDDIETIKVESSVVLLNVGVVDKQGRGIMNLSRGDFVVYEDNVQQKILSFEPSTAPFSLVLLLDMSSSTQSFRQPLKQSAFRFLDALSPDDRVAVIAFRDKIETLTNFTTDRKKMVEAIDLAQGKGKTDLYKALSYALEKLSKEGPRRKAIVVLTDGLDTQMMDADRAAAAKAETNEAALSSIKPETSATLNGVLNTADKMGVTIYPLALPSGDPARIPIPTPQQIAIYTSARTRLQTLADRTGGRLNAINHLEDMGRLYAEVAADLRTLYSVAYQSSSESKRDGRWRAIRVEVARPELLARTRPGYYAR
ncbi:MAG TPA: VWA domain-containing protein [Pyrinomonadaceae bacterium]|jgi:VWFA-related protein